MRSVRREVHIDVNSGLVAFDTVRVLHLHGFELAAKKHGVVGVHGFVAGPGFFLFWRARAREACYAVECCCTEVQG